jgi:hypothetical protein
MSNTAIAGEQAAMTADDPEMRRFHARLRILCNIDRWEFEPTIPDARDRTPRELQLLWERFNVNPWQFFICCPDAHAAKLWAIIKKREVGRD